MSRQDAWKGRCSSNTEPRLKDLHLESLAHRFLNGCASMIIWASLQKLVPLIEHRELT